MSVHCNSSIALYKHRKPLLKAACRFGIQPFGWRYAAVCRREVDEREKDPAFISDAYAECYPGYHEYNNQVVDSEDEADYTHMDSKLGKSRTEFNTEEEWQVRTA